MSDPSWWKRVRTESPAQVIFSFLVALGLSTIATSAGHVHDVTKSLIERSMRFETVFKNVDALPTILPDSPAGRLRLGGPWCTKGPNLACYVEIVPEISSRTMYAATASVLFSGFFMLTAFVLYLSRPRARATALQGKKLTIRIKVNADEVAEYSGDYVGVSALKGHSIRYYPLALNYDCPTKDGTKVHISDLKCDCPPIPDLRLKPPFSGKPAGYQGQLIFPETLQATEVNFKLSYKAHRNFCLSLDSFEARWENTFEDPGIDYYTWGSIYPWEEINITFEWEQKPFTEGVNRPGFFVAVLVDH